MAYKYEGGLDLETPLAILGQGIEKYALIKRQQNQIAEAKVDDFLKMYQPGKLRTMDIPDFTNAYTQYKNAALNYTKLNRGGARTEELAVSKVAMDKAMANLNSIYSDSVSALEKQKEYADYQVIARQKGYDIPDEVKVNYNLLSSTPIKSFKVNDIGSAYSYDMVSKNIDMDNFRKFMTTVGAKPIQTKDYVNQREETFAGQKIKARDIKTYTAIPLETAIKSVGMYGQVGAKASERNAFNDTMKKYKQAYEISDDINKDAIVQRLKPIYPNITKDDVTGEMLFGLELSTPEQVSITADDKYYNHQVDEIKFNQKKLTDAQKIQIAKSKKAGGSAQDVGYVDLMGKITGLIEANPNAPMISVSNLDVNSQGTLTDIVQKAAKLEKIPANQMYFKENKDTGEVKLYAASKIANIDQQTGKENIVYQKDEEIGTLDATNINVAASAPYGPKYKQSAAEKTTKQTKEPTKKPQADIEYVGLDANGKAIWRKKK